MGVHEGVDDSDAKGEEITQLHACVSTEKLTVLRRGRAGIETRCPSLQVDLCGDLDGRRYENK